MSKLVEIKTCSVCWTIHHSRPIGERRFSHPEGCPWRTDYEDTQRLYLKFKGEERELFLHPDCPLVDAGRVEALEELARLAPGSRRHLGSLRLAIDYQGPGNGSLCGTTICGLREHIDLLDKALAALEGGDDG